MAKARTKAKTAKVARKPGRPTLYSPEMATRICNAISAGKSLRAICRSVGVPHVDTVRQWLSDHAEFSAQYARAREEQADTLADEIVQIADNAKLDPNDKRVRVDARKWVAAKLKPKKYGEKLDLTGDLGVTHRTADDIRGTVNSILARFGVAPITGGGSDQSAGGTGGRGGRGKAK